MYMPSASPDVDFSVRGPNSMNSQNYHVEALEAKAMHPSCFT